MKYAKFSDDFLSDFRLDDNGETLVLTDKRGYTRAVKLLPYEERPQGKWVKITKDGVMPIEYICNICGRTVKSYYEEYLIEKVYPFCHCGAKMKGGAE